MTIFKTRHPFREEYTPETIIGRDEQISELVSIFQDYVDGLRPPHLLIHGSSGTGKRTLTRHILTELEREIQRHIKTITIDCTEFTSLYQIYVELAYQICEDKYPNGTPQAELERAIFRQMDDSTITWYLILENLEGLKEYKLPFDELQQSISMFGTDQTEFGVIGITNESRLHNRLSGEILYKGNLHTLKTTPYDANQLRRILESHTEVAFTENGVSNAVIPKCAAIVAQETGSAAEALQLLELAGYVGHQANAEQLTEAHLNTARETREPLDTYTTFTQELNPKEQLLCTIIAIHTAVDMTGPTTNNPTQVEEHDENEQITTNEWYRFYTNIAESFALKTVSERRVQQLINNLREKGLVKSTEHNAGQRGGIWLSYKLTIPPDEILRPAKATSGRYKHLLRKHYVSIDKAEVDIAAFLSDKWP